jgi:hypothetical protein
MTYKQKNILFSLLAVFGIFLAIGALAQGNVTIQPPWGMEEFSTFLKRMLIFLFGAAIFAAVVMIVIAGYYFVLGTNIDPNAVQKGKDMIKFVVIGLLLIMGAEAIGWFVYYMLMTGKPPPPGTSL